MEQNSENLDLRDWMSIACFFIGIAFWISLLFFFNDIDFQAILFSIGIFWMGMGFLVLNFLRKKKDGEQGNLPKEG